jgi:hypothetical protein
MPPLRYISGQQIHLEPVHWSPSAGSRFAGPFNCDYTRSHSQAQFDRAAVAGFSSLRVPSARTKE